MDLDIEIQRDVFFKADRMRIEQVLINLVDNAIKHVDVAGKLSISLVEEMNQQIITIANSGNLIPENEFENIWESFYQVDTDTEGNGLGLAIVKSIVELYDGKVNVCVANNMNIFSIILSN